MLELRASFTGEPFPGFAPDPPSFARGQYSRERTRATKFRSKLTEIDKERGNGFRILGQNLVPLPHIRPTRRLRQPLFHSLSRHIEDGWILEESPRDRSVISEAAFESKLMEIHRFGSYHC